MGKDDLEILAGQSPEIIQEQVRKEDAKPPVRPPPSITERDPIEVPIRASDVEKFRKWFCKSSEDQELFDKIMRNIRMIDEEDFNAGVENIRNAILKFVGDEEYYLLVDRTGKSGDLMLEKLELSSKPPLGILRADEIGLDSPKLKSGVKLVLVDDAAFSADRIFHMLNQRRRVQTIDPGNILVGTVAMTNEAADRLKQQGIENIAYTFVVPIVSEEFTSEEIDRYRKKMEEVGDGRSGYETRVLTFSYAKVPDNFLHGLRRMRPILRDISLEDGSWDETYIIDDTEEGIHPPYWKNASSPTSPK